MKQSFYEKIYTITDPCKNTREAFELCIFDYPYSGSCEDLRKQFKDCVNRTNQLFSLHKYYEIYSFNKRNKPKN